MIKQASIMVAEETRDRANTLKPARVSNDQFVIHLLNLYEDSPNKDIVIRVKKNGKK